MFESYHWKQKLKKISLELERKSKRKFPWTDNQHAKFEIDVMIGFYIIRKLCENKRLTDTIAESKIKLNRFLPNEGKIISRLNVLSYERYYNLNNNQHYEMNLRDLYNKIIHAYVFDPVCDQDDFVSGIFFTSDLTRELGLFYIEFKEIITIFKLVYNDFVSKQLFCADNLTKDYELIKSCETLN